MIIANANNAKIPRRWSEGHGSQESSGPLIYPHVTTLIWKNNLDNKYFFGEMSCMKYLCWWDDGGQEPIIVPVWVISDNMGRPLVWPAGLLQCSVSVATPGWAVLQYYSTVRAGRGSQWLALVKIVFISNSQKIESLFVYLTLNWTESICWNAKCLIT